MTAANPDTRAPARRPLTAEEVRALGIIANQHRDAIALRRRLTMHAHEPDVGHLYLTDDKYGDGDIIVALTPDLSGSVLDTVIAALADAAIQRYGIILATPAQEPSK